MRLYKYLVNDYYSEFLSALLAVLARLECVSVAPAAAGANFAKWQHLESLYGKGVFLEGLLSCLNCGLDVWVHHHSASSFAGGVEAADAQTALDSASQLVRSKLGDILRKRLLVVDEHPTLTRMFTFAQHFDGLLLWHFLGLDPQILQCKNVFRMIEP